MKDKPKLGRGLDDVSQHFLSRTLSRTAEAQAKPAFLSVAVCHPDSLPLQSCILEQISRACAQWFREEIGFRIVEYSLGNAITGCIDMLATDDKNVFLITVNKDCLEDALLRSLMGYWWYHSNLSLLGRCYTKEEIDLSLAPVIIIVSPNFIPEAFSIFEYALRPPIRLFRYALLGSSNDPDLYIEELSPPQQQPTLKPVPDYLASLKKELEIEKAGLTDNEIRAFLTSMKEARGRQT
jgi:hypothetical protein